MFKKVFALASVTALMGLVATVASAGCSSTSITASENDAGPAVGDGGKEGKAPVEAGPDEDAAGPAEEGTVGKECTDTADCKVADSKNDNICGKGFATGDLFSTSVCIQQKCTQGAGGTVGDLLCDGEVGLCLPLAAGSKSGICLPFCDFSSTAVATACKGNNKCNLAYSATDAKMVVKGIGSCQGACQADADCKGTAGQKCQIELGICLNADKIEVYPKAFAAGCDNAKDPAECNCNSVGGTGANKDKGICTRQCITGAAGDTACGAAVAGWKCTARLPVVDTMAKALFTGQPPDIAGVCALPCTVAGVDPLCTALATATGAPFQCKAFGGGLFCETSEP